MPQERKQSPQPPQETCMFRDVPMQAFTDLLRTLPIPITITQKVREQDNTPYYTYQVGEPTPDKPIGLRTGATRHFLDAVRISLETVMRQGTDER